MQGAREGMVSEEVAGESVGTPTLTATGNPSDGEMGQLLTREIKSHGDGEYLYAHLLTQREDAPSWTTVELHFLAPNRAAFPGGGGQWLCGDSSRTPSSHRGKNKTEDMLGQARKPCCDSLVTSHGKRRQQNSLYCLDLIDRNPAEASVRSGRQECVPSL